MQAAVSSILAQAALHAKQAVSVDLPDILDLSAKKLRSAPIPHTAGGWGKLTIDEWFSLAPILGTLLLAVMWGIWALAAQGTGGRACRPSKNLASASEANASPEGEAAKSSYWLTRVVLLRGMGLVYLAAFLTSAFQHRAMFGTEGLMPGALRAHHRRPTPAFDALEASLGVPRTHDLALELVSWAGVFLSMMLTFGDAGFGQWAALPAALWGLYLSVVNLEARVVIGYGWEWETLEVGFLMIFLCPMYPSRSPFPKWTPPPMAVLWLLRWGVFRLLIGAGMSKLGQRSSACWRELSCTETHYFTQPMPNPMAWRFHHLPDWFHRAEVALTFVEQLVLPFFVLAPMRRVRLITCYAELFFQAAIVGTGNYAWINWIGALPCLALLDDHVLRWTFPSSYTAAAAAAAAQVSMDGSEEEAVGDIKAGAGKGEKMRNMGEVRRDKGDRRVQAVESSATPPARYSFIAGSLTNGSDGDDESDDAEHSALHPPEGGEKTRALDNSSGGDPSTAVKTAAAAEDNSSSPGRDGGALRRRKRMAPSEPLAVVSSAPHSPTSTRRRRVKRVAAGVARRLHGALLFTVHVLLVGFILCKSAAPIKELFSPAPWLAFYDDYFFVNAQGVFGFINKHRVVLTLSYTHDEVPPAPRGRHDSRCVDTPGPVANDGQGNELGCADVAHACAEYDALRAACPRTCGACADGGGWDDDTLTKAATWKPLEFANLPGDPSRAPRFNSPYHHRLDWEVWIHTTASMESEAEAHEARKRAAAARGAPSPSASRAMQVPRFVQSLAAKVMAGDTDAMSLMGTPAVGTLLLVDNKTKGDDPSSVDAAETVVERRSLLTPRAIRADYWTYTFSDWDEWRKDGVWWRRERLSKPTVYRDVDLVQPPRRRVRRSPWQRPWVLLLATAGGTATAAAALALILGPCVGREDAIVSTTSSSRTGPALPLIARIPAAATTAMRRFMGGLVAPLAPAALGHAVCFYLAIVADYPEWRLPAVDAVPTWALLAVPATAGYAAAALIDALLVQASRARPRQQGRSGSNKATMEGAGGGHVSGVPPWMNLVAVATAATSAELIAAWNARAAEVNRAGIFTRAARVISGHEYAGIEEVCSAMLAVSAGRAVAAMWWRGRQSARSRVGRGRGESTFGAAEVLGALAVPAVMLVMAQRAAELQGQLRA